MASTLAVLDKTGSVELLTVADGESVTSVEAGDDPVGVAVVTDDEGPLLVVADSVVGARLPRRRRRGASPSPTRRPPVPSSAANRAYVGTSDGRVLSLDAEGDGDERYLGDLEVTDLVSRLRRARLARRRALRLLDLDEPRHGGHASTDDAVAVTLGRAEDADTFTTTALDGRITTYAADGAELRTVRAPLRSVARPDVEAAQRPRPPRGRAWCGPRP